MDWVKQLSPFEGTSIRIWIEDRSGEEQTKPKDYTLFKVKKSSDQEYLQFYLNPTQFLTVPVFNDERTRMERIHSEEVWVSHDRDAKLLYWIYFVVKAGESV
jgi:hypothetical protein